MVMANNPLRILYLATKHRASAYRWWCGWSRSFKAVPVAVFWNSITGMGLEVAEDVKTYCWVEMTSSCSEHSETRTVSFPFQVSKVSVLLLSIHQAAKRFLSAIWYATQVVCSRLPFFSSPWEGGEGITLQSIPHSVPSHVGNILFGSKEKAYEIRHVS